MSPLIVTLAQIPVPLHDPDQVTSYATPTGGGDTHIDTLEPVGNLALNWLSPNGLLFVGGP